MPLCMETNGLTSRARQLLLLTQAAGRLSYDVWIRIINMESLFTFIIFQSICMYLSNYLYMYQHMHVCKYTRARTHIFIILYHIFYLTSSYAFLRRPIFTYNILSLNRQTHISFTFVGIYSTFKMVIFFINFVSLLYHVFHTSTLLD